MEEKNKIERSETWIKIHEIVNTLPISVSSRMDEPTIIKVTTELTNLFLELVPIYINKHQSELLLQAYKDGFDSATECLIGANRVVQKRK